jgi:hypothetical protein
MTKNTAESVYPQLPKDAMLHDLPQGYVTEVTAGANDPVEPDGDADEPEDDEDDDFDDDEEEDDDEAGADEAPEGDEA